MLPNWRGDFCQCWQCYKQWELESWPVSDWMGATVRVGSRFGWHVFFLAWEKSWLPGAYKQTSWRCLGPSHVVAAWL